MADNLLRVKILADTKQLGKSLNTASSKLKSFGSKMTSIGSSLQSRLALPLLAAGGAAIKMAVDFDTSMTQIKTLVGVASAEVDQMGIAAAKMAQTTGISSNEAAEALFFITSAGLRGADAMAVLEQSLQASAIGLGDTKVIADLATSALNAYGIKNLSAAEATDVLTGAVREGKLSADSLAQSMGTVLPVASQLGVKFSEVGATFAAMSRTGTDASMAATSIRGIMFALLKPTEMAHKTLDDFNLSAKGLRQQIKDEGLLSTLKTLTETFGDNEEAQGKVFNNTKALSGVLDLMGKNLSSTEAIYKSMNNTAGLTAEAFKTLQESAAFKLKKAMNDIGVEFTKLGSTLLTAVVPLIQKFSKFVLILFSAFQKLSPQMKNFSISLGLILTVLPTMMMLFGGIASAIGVIISPVGLVVAGIVALVLASNDLMNVFNDLEITIKTALINSLDWATEKFDLFINSMNKYGAIIGKFFDDPFDTDFTDINNSFDLLAENIKKNGKETRKTNTETSKLLKNYNDYPSVLSQIVDQFTFVETATKKVTKTIKKIPDLNKIFGSANMETPIEALASSNSWDKLNNKIIESGKFMQDFEENRLDNLKETAKEVGYAVAGAFEGMAHRLIDSLNLADTGFQGFVKGLLSTITKLIGMMLSAAISQAIMGATTSGTATGPAAVITTPAFIATAVGGVLSAFAAIPKFADGGIVSGPTLGLMGEYPGSKSNPEVIAPLDKLKGMIGQGGQNINVGGEFRIQGQDLVVALQRADRNRSRIK
tara:strand:+ start:2531 stop:4837 length:2307 start_codon:yes stop_codon:yes gene_type:complete